jgi:hypothetical protein
VEDEEDDEEGEESGNEGANKELFGSAGVIAKFTKSFGWLHSAVKVREVTGYNIDQTFEMNIIEFLNYMSYIKSYNAMVESVKKEQENKGKRYY